MSRQVARGAENLEGSRLHINYGMRHPFYTEDITIYALSSETVAVTLCRD